ncbi:MAG: Flp pilus assembly protein CpaB [Chloroflexi bacterium]|nr:Flp pilus assembly protein CpaB [Chloroflexota bacterium]
MKRSNRLVLLVGVFLAIVAFVGIILTLGQGGGGGTGEPPVPTTGKVVVASADIPLSTRIRADQLKVIEVDLTAITPGTYGDTSQVVGQIARQPIANGAQITPLALGISGSGQITNIDCPAGLRCMAIQVDQLTGVGTVIKTGDYVDMIIGLQGEQFPVITTNPVDDSVTVVLGINATSVKAPLLLQGLQVVGTLLPPPPAAVAADPNAPTPEPGAPATALNEQQQIVILAVTPQQEEVIRFAQLSGAAPLGAVSLVLRSAEDFIDPVTGEPIVSVPVDTTGVVLKTLVDSYGVLPPEVVETVTPVATKNP